MLKFYFILKFIGIKSIKINAPYPNICVASMFHSFKVDQIIRCLCTTSVHHE
jgi:hypothetical protein